MMMYTFCVCILSVVRLSSSVEVTTKYGPVIGSTVNVNNGQAVSSVDVFLGIPFAQDTSGPNRFKKPVAPLPWTEPLVADRLGPSCPQPTGLPLSPGGLFGSNCLRENVHPKDGQSSTDETDQERIMPKYLTVSPDTFSEDCLSLNIYSPNATGGPYPVLFWAFGGGYQVGSSGQYHGYYKATYDTVIVTFNYRLNIFGFAATQDKELPGNLALWDSKMALQFVVDNIAQFGGDPGRITVGGHSAGSISASFLMLSPQTKDMFQQVLPISSTETTIGAIRPVQDVDDAFRQVAISLGCEQTDTKSRLECLSQISWTTFFRNATWPELAFGPIVDGQDGFLPEEPEILRDKGDVMTGPMLAVMVHDDGAAYTGILLPEAFGNCCSSEYFGEVVEKRFVDCFDGDHGRRSHDLMATALRVQYAPHNSASLWANRAALTQILTDNLFTVDWDSQMLYHSRVGPTYGLVYNYRSRNFTQAVLEWMGIPHGGMLPFMWGWTYAALNPDLPDTSRYEVEWTDEDRIHTHYLMEVLANFYKTGNLTSSPVMDPFGLPTKWPQYAGEVPRVTVISNITIATEPWRRYNLAFWNSVMPALRNVPDEDTKECPELTGTSTRIAPSLVIAALCAVVSHFL